jgi:hypothetical protein
MLGRRMSFLKAAESIRRLPHCLSRHVSAHYSSPDSCLTANTAVVTYACAVPNILVMMGRFGPNP